MTTPGGKSLVNGPNTVNRVTAGCTCDVCSLEPFDAGVGTYTKEDMNAVFQMLVGEATSPGRAHQLGLNASSADHEREAFAISSAIFNRAHYDHQLMVVRHRPAPVTWGFMSDGTPLGVANSGKVVAYTDGTHRTYFEQARRLGELNRGKPYCEWLVILKAQAKRAAESPAARDPYNEWRTHSARTSAGRTQFLGNDLFQTQLGYPDLARY